MFEVVRAGAHVLNLSLAVLGSSPRERAALHEALDFAVSRDVLVVVAAGNQGIIGGAVLTQHPRVVPVAACDERGVPLDSSNLGGRIARRGLLAPGRITALPTAKGAGLSGTSVATAFVSGTAALLRSLHPSANAGDVAIALAGPGAGPRTTVVPPLLNAGRAHRYLQSSRRQEGAA